MTMGELKTTAFYDALNVSLGEIMDNQNILISLRSMLTANLILSSIAVIIGIAILIQLKKLKDKP